MATLLLSGSFYFGDQSKVVVEEGKSLRLGFRVLVHSAEDEQAINLKAAYNDYLNVRTDAKTNKR